MTNTFIKWILKAFTFLSQTSHIKHSTFVKMILNKLLQKPLPWTRDRENKALLLQPKNGRYSEANKTMFFSRFPLILSSNRRLIFQNLITLQVAGHYHCNWLSSNHDISNSTCCFRLLLRLFHTTRPCVILPNLTVIAQYVSANSIPLPPPPPNRCQQ